jgi:integrase
VYKSGFGGYTARHVFRTIADETLDFPAVNLVMGHSDESMAARYRERISDDRLRRVSEHFGRGCSAADGAILEQ